VGKEAGEVRTLRVPTAEAMTNTTDIEMDLDRILKLQHEMSRILADVVDPLAGLESALTRVAALPDVAAVWAWFRSDATGDFFMQEAVGLDPVLAVELDVLSETSAPGQQLLDRQEVSGTGPQIWPEKASVFAGAGWNGVTILPIISQGQLVGALGSGFLGGACAEERQVLVLRTLANAIGSLVATIRRETGRRTMSDNLERLLDAFGDAMFVVDPGGIVLHHNRAAAEMCRQPRPLVGSGAGEILPEYARLRRTVDSVAQLVAPGRPAVPLQTHLVVGPDRKCPVEIRIEPGSWNDAPADIVVCQDISGRLEMVQENQRLATAIEQVVEAIVVTDKAGTIQYVNPAFTTLTGYASDEVVGRNPRLLKSGEHSEPFYRDMWRTLLDGQVWAGRLVNRRKNGEHYNAYATISPVRTADKGITHFVAVNRDVTAELILEERLRESQKMEALGTLAGGIAHDFNNILYALMGYVDLARDDVPEGHPARGPLDEIGKAGERAAALVAKMLAFGRRRDGSRHMVTAAVVVDEALELVRATLPSTLRLETSFGDGACRVLADRGQLQQMLLNLCANAQQAMQQTQGTIAVAVDQVELTPQMRAVRPGLQPGSWVRIVVSDTGPGIEPAIMERIFEPYFTTRSVNEGSGLGLATVHGIATGHGGAVFAESTPGCGATFTIYLPAQPEAVLSDDRPIAPPRVDAAAAESALARGRIMIVDDDDLVADVFGQGLTRLGFAVQTFTDSRVAWTAFQAASHAYDVVLTDQNMPEIDGFELAARMRALRPELAVLLVTGQIREDVEERARQVGIAHIVCKPLQIQELGEILEKLTSNVV
jgi:PAS domain S-box-containing protein